jgi:uncharacterized protein YndB with AHSA1/START domain
MKTDFESLTLTPSADRAIILTRLFDAPRKLVFDALTRPELLERWFGPREWTLAVCEVDLRVGGNFHYVLRRADGCEMSMRGRYREIERPNRLVHTESFDHWFPGESMVTTALVEHAGMTTFSATVRYPSREIRDEALDSGMEHSVGEAYDKLDELLASIHAEKVAL